jgi:putative transposase
MPVQKLQKIDKNKVYYHIYNKGVENKNLFNDNRDYDVFLDYLKDYLTAPPDPEKTKKSFSVNGRVFHGVPHQLKNYFNKVELIAYNLMPDHFHLVVNQKTRGSLEKLIRSLCTRYAIYYNKKYQRRGSLFSGPYKLVPIKDVSQLLHLTRYLHRESFKRNGDGKDANLNGHSSYEEYLGERETSWIKPKVVLSHFSKSKNDSFKEIGGYKNFVEKYELKQKEKEMLERIIIESEPEHLERRVLKPEESKSFQEVRKNPVIEPRSKIPEFIAAATVVFVLLFTLGIRNIRTSVIQTKLSKSSTPPPTSQISGLETEAEDAKPEPKKILVIKINDKSESVNLRQEPTTKSEKVGKAKDGDTFELVSKDSKWYQIKLADGSIAFVSARYAEIEGEENK